MLSRREYDVHGRVISDTDADDVITDWYYTKTGLVESVEVSQGASGSNYLLSDTVYDDVGRPVDVYADGVERSIDYDSWDRPVHVEWGTSGASGYWEQDFGWTDGDLMDWETVSPVHGASSATTNFVYDDWGRLVQRTNPDSSFVAWERDVLGRVRLFEDEEGGLSETTYDSRGRVIFQSVSGGGQSTYSYVDGASYAGQSGLLRTVAVNGAGDLSESYADLAGRSVADLLPDGTEYQYGWMGTDLVLQEHVDASGSVMASRAWQYDMTTGFLDWDWGWFPGTLGSGASPSSTDYHKSYSWSDAGRLLVYSGPEEDTTYTYDAGYLASETWGIPGLSQQQKQFTRGASYPWVTQEDWTGATGSVRSSAFTRNTVGAVTRSLVSDGMTVVDTLAVDQDAYGNSSETTRFEGSDFVSHSWNYDLRGRPIQRETTVSPGSSQLTTWEWYDNNAAKIIETGSGRTMFFERSLNGDDFELSRGWVNGILVGEVTARDGQDRPTGVATPGSHVVSLSYDSMGRTQAKHSTGAWGTTTWQAVYDGRGQMSDEYITDSTTGANLHNSFTYAEPGFLVQETRGGPTGTGDTIDYVLDDAGRRVEKRTNGVVDQTLVWSGSVLASVDGTAIGYDDWDGVLTDQHGYSYDRAADGKVSFVMDPSGNTVNAFMRGPSGLVWENDEGGANPRRTTWGLGLGDYPIETTNSAGEVLSYMVADGMLLGQFDSSGVLPTLASPNRSLLKSDVDFVPPLTAFGEGTQVPSSSDDRFAYAGMESLPGTPGVQMAQQRLYDSETGRFLSPDPIGLDGGPFRSRYGLGNPTRFTDPSGYAPKQDSQNDQRPDSDDLEDETSSQTSESSQSCASDSVCGYYSTSGGSEQDQSADVEADGEENESNDPVNRIPPACPS